MLKKILQMRYFLAKSSAKLVYCFVNFQIE